MRGWEETELRNNQGPHDKFGFGACIGPTLRVRHSEPLSLSLAQQATVPALSRAMTPNEERFGVSHLGRIRRVAAPPAPWARAAEHLFGACAAGARICADSLTPDGLSLDQEIEQ